MPFSNGPSAYTAHGRIRFLSGEAVGRKQGFRRVTTPLGMQLEATGRTYRVWRNRKGELLWQLNPFSKEAKG